MIIQLADTTVHEISRRLVEEREAGGAVALSRVLTLIINAGIGEVEPAIAAANTASHEHPCRVIALVREDDLDHELDAELRLGGDAGASEVIILRHSEELADHLDTLVLPLLLPDAPVVVYWPGAAPQSPSTDPLGRLGQRRITDSYSAPDGLSLLRDLRANYAPGDTDLAWTRTTLWRGLIAAQLDQPPYEPVLSARVVGEADHPALDLLGAWLALRLDCPVEMERVPGAPGLTELRLERESGPIVLSRPFGDVAALLIPDQPAQYITLPKRPLSESLAEDLRRWDEDEVYADVLRDGLPLIEEARQGPLVFSSAEAVAAAAADRLVKRIGRQLEQHEAVHIALTGGTVGTMTLAKLAAHPDAKRLDWSRVHLWWGDERFLPEGDSQRNETAAREVFLDLYSAQIPETNIHFIPRRGSGLAGESPQTAARAYARELAEHAPEGADVPSFDVVLLGMGPDGHVASLFPGNRALRVGGATVGVDDSPKPPPQRVSLTFEALNRAQAVWFVVAGDDKAEAVAAAWAGAPREEIPAAGVSGTEETEWFVDEASARSALGPTNWDK